MGVSKLPCGFSATVFQDNNDQYTLAIRGTEGQAVDVLEDFLNVGVRGLGIFQGLDLFSYMQRSLATQVEDIEQYSFDSNFEIVGITITATQTGMQSETVSPISSLVVYDNRAF